VWSKGGKQIPILLLVEKITTLVQGVSKKVQGVLQKSYMGGKLGKETVQGVNIRHHHHIS